jgi:ubiquinol oxidase
MLIYRFTGTEMEQVGIAHRPTNTLSDNVALYAVRFARFCMDKLTGYRHPLESDGDNPKLAEKGKMTEAKWLVRIIFLESVAAVPGMVGGMLRHLHSLRRMKRDNGWVCIPDI